LTFDLLTSGSVHAEVLPCNMSTDFDADSSSRTESAPYFVQIGSLSAEL